MICYPLWLGSMPAILKAFFEQIGRVLHCLAGRKSDMEEAAEG